MKYQWFAAPIHAQGQRPVHLFPRGARRHRAFSQYPSAPNTRMEIPTGRVFRAHRPVTIRTRSDSLTQCCSWFLRPPPVLALGFLPLLFVLVHRFRQKARIYASSSKVNSPAAPAVARKRRPWLLQDLCNNALITVLKLLIFYIGS